MTKWYLLNVKNMVNKTYEYLPLTRTARTRRQKFFLFLIAGEIYIWVGSVCMEERKSTMPNKSTAVLVVFLLVVGVCILSAIHTHGNVSLKGSVGPIKLELVRTDIQTPPLLEESKKAP